MCIKFAPRQKDGDGPGFSAAIAGTADDNSTRRWQDSIIPLDSRSVRANDVRDLRRRDALPAGSFPLREHLIDRPALRGTETAARGAPVQRCWTERGEFPGLTCMPTTKAFLDTTDAARQCGPDRVYTDKRYQIFNVN